MALQTKLDEMRKEFETTAPADALAIMHRATADLVASGVLDEVLKPGQQAPEFSLTDHDGNRVKSAALLADGPLVIGFYRGIW